MALRFCDNCENKINIEIRTDKTPVMICVMCSLAHDATKNDTLFKKSVKVSNEDKYRHIIMYMDQVKYIRKIEEKCRNEKCDGNILSYAILGMPTYKCDKCLDAFVVEL
jgi:hypothetical protein